MITIDKEFQEFIDPLLPEEKQDLEELIVADGCQSPIVLWGNIIVDGHNRYEICTRLNIPFETITKDFESRLDVLKWMDKLQNGRRNVIPFNKGLRALKLKDSIAADAKQRQLRTEENREKANLVVPTLAQQEKPEPRTREKLAAIAGVSNGTMQKIETIASKANEETLAAVRSGEMSISQAFNETKKAEKATATRAAYDEKLELASKVKIDESTRPASFDVILADPPWRYEFAETDNG